MTCIRIRKWRICVSPSFRLPLSDGTRIYMSWHRYCGPTFYRDRWEQREIEEWYKNPLICEALDWFMDRGYKA